MSPSSEYTNGVNGHSSQPVDPTAARHNVNVKVNSPNVNYSSEHVVSNYTYHGADVTESADGTFNVNPTESKYQFKTQTKVPKTGLLLVGLGGNNGTTLVGTILANKHNISWNTKEGVQTPNYLGSVVRGSTVRLGTNPQNGKDVHVPLSQLVPTVHPNDLVVGGWDISAMPLDKAARRAQVLEWDLQRQLAPYTKDIVPMPSIYYPDFIAANQEDRADNVIPGTDKKAHLEQIRKDIRDFKAKNDLDKVIVLWTANTERYADIIPGINDTGDNLIRAIESSHEEVAPSTIFAVASILENAPFINGAPQNTLVPGVINLAEQKKAFVGGDDFKSGQTKFKSVLVEFLVNAGIKPLSIASYNHLGNNDGKNLSSQRQFKSKEISKSSVVDDMVEANHLLYKRLPVDESSAVNGKASASDKKTEHPDHCVVIKYMPAVGDDKRAMDDYFSELCMGGRSVISVTNICQDSLLAVPLILDLTLLAELLTRVEYTDEAGQPQNLYSVLSLLSYMLKAPVVRPGTDVVNGLSRQRGAIEHFLRALVGLQPLNEVTTSKLFW